MDDKEVLDALAYEHVRSNSRPVKMALARVTFKLLYPESIPTRKNIEAVSSQLDSRGDANNAITVAKIKESLDAERT